MNEDKVTPGAEKSLGRRSFLVTGVAAVGGAGLLLAGCSPSTPSGAPTAGSGKLAEVLNRGKLIVGTGTGNPPWHFQDASGVQGGFDIAMARIVANGLFGKPDAVDFVQEAPDARIPNLVTNKVDVVFQFMTVNAKRAQQVEFTIPYYREGAGLLVGKNSKYKTYDELKAAGNAVKVSVLMNADADTMVHVALADAQTLQIDTQANVIQAVDSGKADAAAVDQSTVLWLVVQQPDKYVDPGFGWYPQTYAAAVRPGDHVWLNFLNQVLHEAMTGTDWPSYADAFKKYFGKDLDQPYVGFPQEYAPLANPAKK